KPVLAPDDALRVAPHRRSVTRSRIGTAIAAMITVMAGPMAQVARAPGRAAVVASPVPVRVAAKVAGAFILVSPGLGLGRGGHEGGESQGGESQGGGENGNTHDDPP